MKKETINLRVNSAIKWIDELKETKEAQGMGQLGDSEDGFCCLGIGCSILGIGYEAEEGTSDLFTTNVGLLTPNGHFKHVRKFFDEFNSLALTDLNDQEGYSFKEIHDTIKDNLARLFKPIIAKGLINHYKKQL